MRPAVCLILVLAACGSRAAPVAPAGGPAPEAPSDAWPHWTAAAQAPVDFTREMVDTLDRLPTDEPIAEAELAPLRALAAQHGGALDEIGAAVAADTCTLPEGVVRADIADVPSGLLRILVVLEARALVAVRDGDRAAAVRDIEALIAAPRALLACRAGVQFASLIGAIGVAIVDAAGGVARRVDGDERARVLRALETSTVTIDDVAQAVADDAARARTEDRGAASPQDAAYFVAAIAGAQGRVDALVDAFTAHPRVEDHDATVTLIQDGLAAMARRLPDATGVDELAEPAVAMREALLAELGPAAVLFTDPDAVAGGVPAEVTVAFDGVTNPVGRFVAATVLAQEAQFAGTVLNGLGWIDRARLHLLAELGD